jgi:hypothetical protein
VKKRWFSFLKSKYIFLLFLPIITFAGGSGYAHLDSDFLIILFIILILILGFVFLLITSFFKYGIRSTRKKWYKDRDCITDFLSEKGFKMILSDLETGVILYKNKEQKIEINKHKNQWFIIADKNELKSKNVFKAHKNIEDLNISLMKFLQIKT